MNVNKLCLNQTIRLIRNGGKETKSSSTCSDPSRINVCVNQDRRDRQPPPEQHCQGGGDPASEKQLVCFANCCFSSCTEQSHKDSVRKATVEEQMKQGTVQFSMRVRLHLSVDVLPALDLAWIGLYWPGDISNERCHGRSRDSKRGWVVV